MRDEVSDLENDYQEKVEGVGKQMKAVKQTKQTKQMNKVCSL